MRTHYLNKPATLIMLALLALMPVPVSAETFRLPDNGDTVVGDVNLTSVVGKNMVLDLAMTYDQGYEEMRLANPQLDMFAPGDGAEVLIPSQYVLPAATPDGIVINVPEMRLYYFPRAKPKEPKVVITHPISIGREDWVTPHGTTKVTAKIKDPVWVPPESIRKEHMTWGDVLPKVVPAGPDNPMGQFAIKLGLPGYFIHGTDEQKSYGIGMRVTHGCIRMYPKDIESLFMQIPVGTPVQIINQPLKVGRLKGSLYLEAHPHLLEDPAIRDDHYAKVVNLLIAAIGQARSEVDWAEIRSAVGDRNGIPVSIGQYQAVIDKPAAKIRSADNGKP
jgi:L,D-transpeptidase ErfK/SrfK